MMLNQGAPKALLNNKGGGEGASQGNTDWGEGLRTAACPGTATAQIGAWLR